MSSTETSLRVPALRERQPYEAAYEGDMSGARMLRAVAMTVHPTIDDAVDAVLTPGG